jgi:hypothetical protein
MEPAGTSHKRAPAVITERTTDPWTVVLRRWPKSKVVDIASGLARHALAECPDASGSLRRVGSTHHFRDYAVKVPQPGLVVAWMIAKIEDRGAVQAAIRELQPDWLIDPDSIAAQGTSQKR